MLWSSFSAGKFAATKEGGSLSASRYLRRTHRSVEMSHCIFMSHAASLRLFLPLLARLYSVTLMWRSARDLNSVSMPRPTPPRTRFRRLCNVAKSTPSYLKNVTFALSNNLSTPTKTTKHTYITVKMARRPARCYRYCKNKVRPLHDPSPQDHINMSAPTTRMRKMRERPGLT